MGQDDASQGRSGALSPQALIFQTENMSAVLLIVCVASCLVQNGGLGSIRRWQEDKIIVQNVCF
jgi:hypothetical protein